MIKHFLWEIYWIDVLWKIWQFDVYGMIWISESTFSFGQLIMISFTTEIQDTSRRFSCVYFSMAWLHIFHLKTAIERSHVSYHKGKAKARTFRIFFKEIYRHIELNKKFFGCRILSCFDWFEWYNNNNNNKNRIKFGRDEDPFGKFLEKIQMVSFREAWNCQSKSIIINKDEINKYSMECDRSVRIFRRLSQVEVERRKEKNMLIIVRRIFFIPISTLSPNSICYLHLLFHSVESMRLVFPKERDRKRKRMLLFSAKREDTKNSNANSPHMCALCINIITVTAIDK